MSGLRIAVVGERVVGTGAGEASVALSNLMMSRGHEVRVFGADSVNMPENLDADYEVFGEWSALYEAIHDINYGGQPAAMRDAQVTAYHEARNAAMQRLIDLLGDYQPDVVHFHNVAAVLSSLGAIEVSRRWPLLWTLHDRFAFDQFHNQWTVDGETMMTWEKTVAWTTSFLGRDLLGASLTPIDFISPSRWLMDLAAASPLGKMHRFHVIRNAVSEVTPAGLLDAGTLRRTLDADRLLLTVVPRPDYTLKGFDITMEAFFRARALLSHQGDTADTELGMIVTTVQDLELSDWGIYTIQDLNRRGLVPENGYLTQGLMRDLYRSVDAVVIGSRIENLPNVAVEATRDACPIVATRVGGVPEIFDDGVAGRLVPPDSEIELAEAIIDVVVRNARDTYEKGMSAIWASEFEPARIAERLEERYLQAVAAHA